MFLWREESVDGFRKDLCVLGGGSVLVMHCADLNTLCRAFRSEALHLPCYVVIQPDSTDTLESMPDLLSLRTFVYVQATAF